jgi:hypothetical protein
MLAASRIVVFGMLHEASSLTHHSHAAGFSTAACFGTMHQHHLWCALHGTISVMCRHPLSTVSAVLQQLRNALAMVGGMNSFQLPARVVTTSGMLNSST